MDVYKAFKEAFFRELVQAERGDPNATPEAIFDVVDSENPPLRFNLGSHNLPAVRKAYAEMIAIWAEWDEVSAKAQGSTM